MRAHAANFLVYSPIHPKFATYDRDMSALSHAARGDWRRRAVGVAVLVVLSAVVAVALLFASRVTAHTAADMGHLEFGLPVSWVTQDQYLSPTSFPYVAQFLSPWEHPTAISAAALILNVLVLSLGLWVGLHAWRRLTRWLTGTTVGLGQTRGAGPATASPTVDQSQPAPGAAATP